jgi:hypothetical protein
VSRAANYHGSQVTVDDYLVGKSPDAVALFRRFAELCDACGPSEVTPRTSIVYWKRDRIWAGAFCNGRKLELNIDLLRPVEHPRNVSVFATTKRVVTHRLRISEPRELDESIAVLLREAYDTVGPGTRKKSD